MSRNPRAARKSQDKPPATAGEPRSLQVLVWRTCLVCDWEGSVVETGDADAICPRCHGLTELVAMAPVPAGGAPGEQDAVASLKHRQLADHKRPRRPKQRKR